MNARVKKKKRREENVSTAHVLKLDLFFFFFFSSLLEILSIASIQYVPFEGLITHGNGFPPFPGEFFHHFHNLQATPRAMTPPITPTTIPTIAPVESPLFDVVEVSEEEEPAVKKAEMDAEFAGRGDEGVVVTAAREATEVGLTVADEEEDVDTEELELDVLATLEDT